MPSKWEFAVRLLVALALSGAIGLERELKDKSAGLRTHMSVALGCALFAIVSAYSFDFFGRVGREQSSYQVDVTRIASTVVTGIGFLGGGAILKHGATVRGLTTAGSLWVTAAVGMAAGLGQLFLATLTTAILLLALVGFRRPARWAADRWGHRDEETVIVTLLPGADPGPVVAALYELPHLVVGSLAMRNDEGRTLIEARLKAPGGREVERYLGPLLARDDVGEVELG